jgi:Domain of unknown function (DUF4326)
MNTAPRVLNKRHGKTPAGSIYVGRPSKWGNPFKIPEPEKPGDRAMVITQYRHWICNQPDLMAAMGELKGRNLVCWCAPLACHADVLLEISNS